QALRSAYEVLTASSGDSAQTCATLALPPFAACTAVRRQPQWEHAVVDRSCARLRARPGGGACVCPQRHLEDAYGALGRLLRRRARHVDRRHAALPAGPREDG